MIDCAILPILLLFYYFLSIRQTVLSMPDFYITLAGTVEKFEHIFHLPKQVNFYKNWEVGLSSLSLAGDLSTKLTIEQRQVKIKKKDQTQWTILNLPLIAYDGIATFIEAISQLFLLASPPWTGVVEISMIHPTKLVLIHVHEDYELMFSNELSKILGLTEELIFREDFYYYFPYQIDLTSPHFAINLNIIEDSMINNYFNKTLKIINFKDRWANFAFKEDFPIVHYHKVVSKHFSSLEIKISQILGIPLDSKSLEISAILHFRRQE